MIDFHYKISFSLNDSTKYADWVCRVIKSENAVCGEINFIFCTDVYLLGINRKYLNHHTLTDVITFDYTEGKILAGDIFISIDRVKENAATYQVSFLNEVKRVMVHGILHLLGYSDKSDIDKLEMRKNEEKKIKLFHVEQ